MIYTIITGICFALIMCVILYMQRKYYIKEFQKIKISEESYRNIFENSTIGLYRTTPDGKILLANRTLINKLGYSTFDELLSRNLERDNFEPTYERKQFIELIESKGEVYGLEELWKRHDGSSLFMRESARVVRDENGKTLYYDGTVEDFTETKQIIERLQESEKIFSDMFMKSPVSTMLNVPYVGTILDVNESFLRESEYSRDELIGKSFLDFNFFNDLRDRQDILDTIIAKGSISNLEIRFQTKSGKKHYGLLDIVFVKLRGEVCELVTIINITERKQAEINLQLNEEKYRKLNLELNKINLELITSKEKAEESDRLKTAFLQNMSHEIRTPMNAIMGFSELLIKQYNNKPKLEKYSNIINQRCNDLLEIINDLLDIAKIESGQVNVNFESCNLNDLFEDLTNFFSEHRKRLGKINLKFILKNFCAPQENFIITDKVKLKEIFINLLDNAFKFTDKGSIEGGCKFDANGNILFYVSDTGTGIPIDKQGRIFDRFIQLNPDENKVIAGTGLGLSIVKGLVNLLGGEIFVESRPGYGSTFSFSVSYKAIVPAHTEVSNHTAEIECYYPGKIVLIVEDDQFNTDYIKEILSATGVSFLNTGLGYDAVRLTAEQPVDLVLMDIGLPDINGYETTRKIRQFNQDIKIIAQTAYVSHFEKQKAIEAGCNDYISKPTRQETLLSMINKHLKQ